MFEILIGLLSLGRFVSTRLAALGAALSCIIFLTTISFMFSTPGVIELSLGFPLSLSFQDSRSCPTEDGSQRNKSMIPDPYSKREK
ncbi:DUF417 family protein [Paenibacillus rhizosphaerae]|uniref:DUF417 family protein n=1 Tax=Paenibacillus rhizosphaerae TaxID=297318 RepID=UPI003D766C4F